MKSSRIVDGIIKAAKNSRPPGRPQKYAEPAVHISISMPPTLGLALNAIARRRGESRSSFIVSLVEDWLARTGKRADDFVPENNVGAQ